MNWCATAVVKTLQISCVAQNKGGVGAAVAAEVELARHRVYAPERARADPLIRRRRPGGARLGSEVAAVRPAKEHAEVHAGHVCLAATGKLPARELRAPIGALLVCRDDGDFPQAPVITDAIVVVALAAVIHRGWRWLGGYRSQSDG